MRMAVWLGRFFLTLREHLPVPPVPITLKPLLRIVPLLRRQEFPQSRMAGLHLIAARPAVIGEEVAAAALDGEIGQRAERVGRAFLSFRGVLHAEVEDDTGPGLPRPGEGALAVALDQPHRAVDDVGAAAA